MAEMVQRGGIRKSLEQLATLKRRFSITREQTEEKVSNLFLAVEVIGAAGAWGWANTKYGKGGPVKIMGFDGDLIVGFGLIGAALFNAAGKHSEHLLNLGAGSASSWANRFGAVKAQASMTTGYAGAGQFQAGYAGANQYAAGYAGANQYQPA